jgi:hypothetical protein
MKLRTLFLVVFAALALTVRADLESQFTPIALGMMTFPQHPTERAFREIESKMSALPKLGNSDKDNHLLLLSAAFLAGGNLGHGWSIDGKSQTGRAALEVLSKKGKVAAWAWNDSAIDDSKLDFWWTQYFGSQDEKVLLKIMKYAGDPTHYTDARALWVQLASWSFKSNCSQIPSVREFAQRRLHDPAYKDRQAFLQSCLAQKTVGITPPRN